MNTNTAALALLLAAFVGCDQKKCADSLLEAESPKPSASPSEVQKLAMKNKCTLSQGGLYVFAGVHTVTSYPAHNGLDAHEEAEHIGWSIVCKSVAAASPCQATRLNLGDLESGEIVRMTSIDRDDFKVAPGATKSRVVLRSTAMGRPTFTVDLDAQTIVFASQPDGDPATTHGSERCFHQPYPW